MNEMDLKILRVLADGGELATKDIVARVDLHMRTVHSHLHAMRGQRLVLAAKETRNGTVTHWNISDKGRNMCK